MGEGRAAHIFQVTIFDGVPDPLVGVEFWRIPGQSFQAQPRLGSLGQIVCDRLAAVDGGAVPDHQQFAGEDGMQRVEKADDGGAVKGRALHLKIQRAGARHGTDAGEVVVRQVMRQDRGVAARRPGFHHAGHQVHAGFIDAHDQAARAAAVFLAWASVSGATAGWHPHPAAWPAGRGAVGSSPGGGECGAPAGH